MPADLTVVIADVSRMAAIRSGLPVSGRVVWFNNSSLAYSVNANTNFQINPTLSLQFNVNYTSKKPSAQGEDSYFLTPNSSVKKTFMKGRLSAMLQWQNMDMGFMQQFQPRILCSSALLSTR